MDKVFVAQRINTNLQATEKSIDTAMMEAAALLTTLIEARRDLKVSTVVGDKEMAALTQALTALDAARHATVDLHNGLAKIAKAMHVPVKMDVVKPQGEVEDRVTMRVAS